MELSTHRGGGQVVPLNLFCSHLHADLWARYCIRDESNPFKMQLTEAPKVLLEQIFALWQNQYLHVIQDIQLAAVNGLLKYK